MKVQKSLILASSSPFRRQQLQQLGLNFDCVSPSIDETQKSNEAIADMVKRLSFEKALTIQNQHPESIIIGSDQSAELDGCPLGKPSNEETAMHQLSHCSGKNVTFYSGLCLLAPNKEIFTSITRTDVTFRKLNHDQIEHYIKRDKPLNCAGSFKCEGLGIALFERIRSDDPSALIGLPLISLTLGLQSFGVDVLLD